MSYIEIITVDLSFLKRDHERDFTNVSGCPTLLAVSEPFMGVSERFWYYKGHNRLLSIKSIFFKSIALHYSFVLTYP